VTQVDTNAIMQRYWAGDRSALADDVVFTDVATGERHEGRDAVVAMLDAFYGEAFEVRAEDARQIVGEGSAAYEATLVGRHVGTCDGVAATGKRVRLPLCVTYRVGQGGILEGRVYFLVDVFRRQVAS
jgi:predicted ester cyclase